MARRKGMGCLEALARWATEWTGSSGAFALAVLTVVAWAATGTPASRAVSTINFSSSSANGGALVGDVSA